MLIFGSEAWLSLFWKYINDPEKGYPVYQGHRVLGGGMLKGPKHEIFGSGFFTETRPVRIGDLGTGKKNEIS
jgi:hypothetical protein